MAFNGICVVVGPLEPAWFFSLARIREFIPSEQAKLHLPLACTTLSGHPLGMTLRDWLRSKTLGV